MKTKHKHYAVLTASTLGLTGLSFASGFGDEKYIYDASGNIVEKHLGDKITRYDYTGNQLDGSDEVSGQTQYQYDTSARLIGEKSEVVNSRKLVHQYLDKVTKVETDAKTTEFFYNAEGQLVGTTSGGTAESFAWDALALVNRGEQLYVNEDHAVGGVPAIVGDDVAVPDMIGSSLSIGRMHFESTAFGEGLDKGLFTGKPFVECLDGFVFMYRTYSARLTQWTSTDPAGFPDGSNPRSYVGNDPTSKFDPLGLVTHNAVPTPYTNNPNTADAFTTCTPANVTQNTINAKQATGSECFIGYFSPSEKYSTSATIHTPVAGTYPWTPPTPPFPAGSPAGNLLVTAGFVTDQQTHENVHVTLFRLFADKTLGQLETWSKDYESNQFSTDPKAKAAANTDYLAASGVVTVLLNQGDSYFGNTAPSHTGWTPTVVPPLTNPLTYTATHVGNPSWGGAATTKINGITIAWPALTPGDCEQ